MSSSARNAYTTTLEGEVETDAVVAFQRRSWLVERAGWIAMAALCVAGALGLLGGGPLAEATLSGERLELRYQRFVRLGAHELLELRTPGDAAEVRVGVSTPYLSRTRVEDVIPQPVRVVAEGDWTTFVFASESDGPVRILFMVAAHRSGLLSGRIRRDGGAPLDFRQLVYP